MLVKVVYLININYDYYLDYKSVSIIINIKAEEELKKKIEESAKELGQ